ncbi:MAG TPA: hypothetical protein VJP86_12560 [Vicinamibacterales bacterium]|jgi:hypothetical protein|nr:hypothetical protein [Vicinamibacterales bacterium]
MDGFRDRPLYRLTRHFFSALFDLGFLSEAGIESFERSILGICTVFFSFGLLLVRVFMGPYRRLSVLPDPEPFRQALLGGDAFVIAVPMWIVAFVTVLVSHALFPDERDFRLLMPLPITKRLVFSAKLLALALFAGVFILATHIAMLPLAIFMSMSRWAEHPMVIRLIAFEAASTLGSIFAVLLVAAVNGALVLTASSGRLMTVSSALRSSMLCALVLSLPLLGRLPALGREFTTDAAQLYASPPAWFVGLERLLLGHWSTQSLRLTAFAFAGLSIPLLATTATYALLYHHFERVTRKPAGGEPRDLVNAYSRLRQAPDRSAVRGAVRRFIGITLRRSPLHQGVLVFVSAIGVGLVLNSLASLQVDRQLINIALASPRSAARMLAFYRRRPGLSPTEATVLWTPFVLMLFSSLAVRTAFTLPVEQRANWIFRMTEAPSARLQALAAAMRSLLFWGVTLPVLASAPLHWTMFDERALATLAMTWICGWVMAEVLMRQWSRIPFSCSYIPGKRFVPQLVLIGIATFVFVTSFGALLVSIVLNSPVAGAVVSLILLLIALGFRHSRVERWRNHPLLFDDELPMELNPLRLSSD